MVAKKETAIILVMGIAFVLISCIDLIGYRLYVM